MDNAVTPNKFMSYYTQYFQRRGIEGSAAANPELTHLGHFTSTDPENFKNATHPLRFL